MRGAPLSDDEVARRKALGAQLWMRKKLPPLYRVSTMDAETVLNGSFGSSSPVSTSYIFNFEDDGTHRPRLEVHTIERGTVEDGAPLLWLSNIGNPIPEPGPPTPIRLKISGSASSGLLLAATADAWMVSAEAADAALVIIGTGELPSPLSLEPVDQMTLMRSEFRNSGVDEAS